MLVHNKEGRCEGVGCVIGIVLTIIVCVGMMYFIFTCAGKAKANREVGRRTEARSSLEDEGRAAYQQSYSIEGAEDSNLPPSGSWSGMYSEKGLLRSYAGEKVSSYTLYFEKGGKMHGTGHDCDGNCSVEGAYSLQKGKIAWLEKYSWGSVEVDGTISVTGWEGSIQASFISTLNISGSLLIKAQNFQKGPRESAKAEMYGNPADTQNSSGEN